MIPARKRSPPGYGEGDGFRKKDIFGPEKPMGKKISIRLAQEHFDSLTKNAFTKLRIFSKDEALQLDVILKKSGTGLVLVPLRIPTIQLEMSLSAFEKNFDDKTVVQFLDPEGRAACYDISDMKRVEYMKDPLWSKTKDYSN